MRAISHSWPVTSLPLVCALSTCREVFVLTGKHLQVKSSHLPYPSTVLSNPHQQAWDRGRRIRAVFFFFFFFPRVGDGATKKREQESECAQCNIWSVGVNRCTACIQVRGTSTRGGRQDRERWRWKHNLTSAFAWIIFFFFITNSYSASFKGH